MKEKRSLQKAIPERYELSDDDLANVVGGYVPEGTMPTSENVTALIGALSKLLQNPDISEADKNILAALLAQVNPAIGNPGQHLGTIEEAISKLESKYPNLVL